MVLVTVMPNALAVFSGCKELLTSEEEELAVLNWTSGKLIARLTLSHLTLAETKGSKHALVLTATMVKLACAISQVVISTLIE